MSAISSRFRASRRTGAGALLAAIAVVLSVAPSSAAQIGRTKEALVTFAGFHANADGSSQLWVDMTERREITVTQKGMTLVYLIDGAKIRIRNNENPLRVEFFPVNVLKAKLDRVKHGVTFTVTLRTATETKYRVVEQTTGAALQVEVPPPLKPAKPSAG